MGSISRRLSLLYAASLLLGALLLGLSCGKPSDKQGTQSIAVACAASLTDLMEAAGAVFSAETGIEVGFEYGSSGALARKIGADAPAEVFISASPQWIQYLQENNRVARDGARLVARNSLVCVSPEGSGVILSGARDLTSLGRVALGDPDHVPAGMYARQALQNLGVWDVLRDRNKMVLSQDVRAVLSLVEQGQVDAGIVYATDAVLSGRIKVAFTFPESSHDPVGYYGAWILTSPKTEPARKFMEFMQSEKFRALLEKNGFLLP